MVELGRLNKLRIKSQTAYGFFLDGENLGEILLPNKYSREGVAEGEVVEVFVYVDSDDKLVATTKKPQAMVGEFAYLPVISVNRVGAFMDLGLAKDLLVRYAEQKIPMQEGRYYLVYIYLDPQGTRMTASSKLDHFIHPDIDHYEGGDEVDIIVWEKTDLGYKVIINHRDLGLLYNSEVFQSLSVGQKTQAYIKKVRDDFKIDLILQKPGYQKPDELSVKILDRLESENGFLALNDKSSAASISRVFGVSKKKFKMAVGSLYRRRVIRISDDGIRLVRPDNS